MILKNRNLKNDILVIAEIGINHNGDFDLCMEMIKQAIKSGADAVKLQSINPKHSYMENTKSFKIFKNKNFDIHQLLKIQKYCQRNKIIFFTTPGDIETLEFLKPLKLDIFKVSSGLFTNTPLIIEILKQGALKAKQAMESTKDMLSKKGRSSKLGERSRGHIDPGAASSAMIINTFFEAIENLDNI